MKIFTRTLATFLFVCFGAIAASAHCTATDNATTSAAIAHGHAYTKHHAEFDNGAVIDGVAFPDLNITNANDFAIFLDGILDAPSQNKVLNNNRHGYWDDVTKTVIIVNQGVTDCGTAFRPMAGVAYYDGLS